MERSVRFRPKADIIAIDHLAAKERSHAQVASFLVDRVYRHIGHA